MIFMREQQFIHSLTADDCDFDQINLVIEHETARLVRNITPNTLDKEKTITPKEKADQILRELAHCAFSTSNIRAIINPILRYMDNYKVWTNPVSAVDIFTAIMYSIQCNLSDVVIERMLSHLEATIHHRKSLVANVLAEIIGQ